MPSPSAVPLELALQPGLSLLSEYVLERLLGHGEGWAVYLARHATRAGERFRVRVMRHETGANVPDPHLERAWRLARLAHPGIVPLVTSGIDTDRGVVAIVSRQFIGVSLRERIERRGRKLTTAEMARIVCEVGDTLDHLHTQDPPVVHGVLDASHVYLTAPDARVRLLGLDESVDESARATTDQFALASIAYECITGERFADRDGESPALPRLDRAGALHEVSADLEWVLHRAWARDEARRFSSAGRLAAEIARLLGEPEGMAAARARHNDAKRTEQGPSSGTRPATRIPPLPSARAKPPAFVPRLPSAPPTVTETPPPAQRPVNPSNAGRYSIHAHGSRPALPTRASEAGRYSIHTERSRPASLPSVLAANDVHEHGTSDLQETRSVRPAVPPPVPRRGPPPLPTRNAGAPEVSFPPSTVPAPVTDAEAAAFFHDDSPASIPVDPLDAPSHTTAEEIVRPSVPIPLVAPSHPRVERGAAREHNPSGRRSLQLAGAIVLALALGGVERLAPRIARVWEHASRSVSHPHVQPSEVRQTASASSTSATQTAHGDEPAPASTALSIPLSQRPGTADRVRVADALRGVVDDCAARVGRDHRHARFQVTFEGSSGAATAVTFGDPTFPTRRLAACITEGALRVRVHTFTDREWVGAYSIMVP